MSTSHARRALRDKSEDESDQVPICQSLQVSSKKSSHQSSTKKTSDHISESSPQKKSRKKTPENAFGPSKATTSHISALPSLLRSTTMSYTVRIPTLGDRPQFLPAGYHTWFLEHFCVGLIRPVHPFYTTVCSRYRVSPSQLQPNFIRFMTGFYLVCMCAGVDVRRF